MHADTALRSEGMKILVDNLGKFEAERFIALMIRESFDYTEWQKDLFGDTPVRELSRLAMEEFNGNTGENARLS